jgi:hypothetical protein
MSKYIICQSFKKFHRAVFSIAHPKYRNLGVFLMPNGKTKKNVLVLEASNKYTHLFLVEKDYFGFNTLESVIVE